MKHHKFSPLFLLASLMLLIGPAMGDNKFTKPIKNFDQLQKHPCIPRIEIGPTGQIYRSGCGSNNPVPSCQPGSPLRASDIQFKIHSITYQANGIVTGTLESVVSGCDGNGQIDLLQLKLDAARWQYKPERANKNGIYYQPDSSVPSQPQPLTYSHVSGTATIIPFTFQPLAADNLTPQSMPLGSKPYCAYRPQYIHVAFNVGGEMNKSDPDIQFPHSVYYSSGGPTSCPTTTADACRYDDALAASEVCHPTTTAGAYCLSAYENNYLDSHGFCNDATTFSNAMQSNWALPQSDSFVRDWSYQSKSNSLSEFMTNGTTHGNSVDILFLSTHGGVSPQDARIALWPDSQEIDTNSDGVRLGEFPGRLSVLVLSSCWVLSGSNVDYGDSSVNGDTYDGSGVDQPVNSGWMFNRWGNVFKGGLRIAVGGADGETFTDLVFGSTSGNPSNFVQNMKNRPIVDAFTDAWQNWDVDQHVGGIASGTNPADCLNRLQAMRFDTLNNFPRLYDSDVKFLCQLHVFHDSVF